MKEADDSGDAPPVVMAVISRETRVLQTLTEGAADGYVLEGRGWGEVRSRDIDRSEAAATLERWTRLVAEGRADLVRVDAERYRDIAGTEPDLPAPLLGA